MAKQQELFRSAEQTEWYLGARRAEVSTYTSGQVHEARIRIRWSDKLGLELGHAFPNSSAALRVAQRINQTKKIRVEHWKREFFPTRGWERRCHAD